MPDLVTVLNTAHPTFNFRRPILLDASSLVRLIAARLQLWQSGLNSF
jgi:hypothetical protein